MREINRLFSPDRRSIGDNAYRNDSSQLRLVTRLTSSRAIVEYYQLSQPLPSRKRDPLYAGAVTHVSLPVCSLPGTTIVFPVFDKQGYTYSR